MPEIKTLDVTPNRLQQGDVLHNGAYVVTGPLNVKQKYVYVPVNDGDTARLKLDETVTVDREVPTADEQETQRIERAHRWIRERMTEAEVELEKARVGLIDSLDMNDPTWHGRRWEHYAAMQIIRQQWLSVVRVAVAQEVDLIEATKLWRKDVAQHLLADLRHGSWSSSTVTNAANHIARQTQAEWIDDLRWYVL